MIDYSHLADISKNNQIFYCTSSGSTGWQSWNKPANAKFVQITVIGGGSGGGAGFGAGINSAAGGGGGAASAMSLGFFPANLLPDKLYVSVGKGGVGGLGTSGRGSAGGAGEISYVCVLPNTTAANVLMQSGAAAATAGDSGTGSVGGAAGTAGTVWAANSVFSKLGSVSVRVGQNGTQGGQLSVGVNVTADGPLTGGASGAYVTAGASAFSGGSIVFGGVIPTLLGSATSATVVNGASGGFCFGLPNTNSFSNYAFLSSGGAGGGSSSAASAGHGGDGGNASFGSGGGGGGGAYNGTGGNGGRGGNGIIIITCL